MSYAERKRYGEMMLNMLDDSLVTPTLYSAFLSVNKKILKKRLMALLEVKPMKKYIWVVAAAISMSVGAIGLTASALASESPVTIDSAKAELVVNVNDYKVEEVHTGPSY